LTDKVELAVIGWRREYVLDDLGGDFTLHWVESAGPGERAGRSGGAGARGVDRPDGGAVRRADGRAAEAGDRGAVRRRLERADLAYARERGIVVTTTPVLYEDVADLAVLLAMDVSRRVAEGDRWVRAKHWPSGHFGAGRRFSGKRAASWAWAASGGCSPPGWPGSTWRSATTTRSRRPTSATGGSPAASNWPASRTSCSSARPGRRAGIRRGRRDAGRARPDGVLINVARGWLVDENALVDAITSGRIGGAGLDVSTTSPRCRPRCSPRTTSCWSARRQQHLGDPARHGSMHDRQHSLLVHQPPGDHPCDLVSGQERE